MSAQPTLPGLFDPSARCAVEWRERRDGPDAPWRRWRGDVGVAARRVLEGKVQLLAGVWPGREFRVVEIREGAG